MLKKFATIGSALPCPGARFRAAVLVLVLASNLAGCGVRGALDAPPEAKVAGTATTGDAADPGQGSVVKPKPHKDFLLDGLLR